MTVNGLQVIEACLQEAQHQNEELLGFLKDAESERDQAWLERDSLSAQLQGGCPTPQSLAALWPQSLAARDYSSSSFSSTSSFFRQLVLYRTQNLINWRRVLSCWLLQV